MSKVILGLYIITTSLGLILLKVASKAGAPIEFINNKLHLNINVQTVLAIILYGMSFVLYMYLISKNDLGYIIPVTAAFVYILIFVASYFIFHEVFTLTKIVGIALILSGLIFINLNK